MGFLLLHLSVENGKIIFFYLLFFFRFLMSTCYPVKAGQSCGGAAGLARKEAHNINTKTQSSELNSMNFKCQKLDIKKTT